MAAECEIEVNGKLCGVQAVGRCVTCGKAFCATHQARTATKYYVDMCTPCFAKSPEGAALAEEAKRRVEADRFRQANWDAEKYFQEGTARLDLLASGIQPVTIYQREIRNVETRTGLFGRRNFETHEANVPTGRGWILGTHMWSFHRHDATDGNDKFWTALLDEPVLADKTNCGLVALEPCPEGYRLRSGTIGSSGWIGFGFTFDMFGWVEAREAVKKLMGPSS